MPKYVDHGLYGASSFTANTTSGSSSITVTAVASGAIGLGQLVVGTNIPANAYIGAAGTGKGGTGTYTLYVNGAAATATGTATGVSVTGTYGNPSVEPAWGIAQDGDGTTDSAATTATISVDMSGWTFTSGSSTFSIMGCTALTIGAGANSATNAQYSATYATMLANIVAAINLATATCPSVPSGFSTAVQVRNAVFARASGNNLQLMTRSGSASWNSTVAITFANVTGSSSQSWSGGVGGAWGYLFTCLAPSWASAVAASGYGVWAANGPYAGVQAAGDVVNARSDKNFRVDFGGPTMANRGAVNNPVRYVIDDSTIWSDGADPVIVINFAGNAGNPFVLTFGTGTANNATIEGKRYASGAYSIHVLASGTGSPLSCVLYGAVLAEGIFLEQASTTTSGTAQLLLGASGTNAKMGFHKCKVKASNSSPFFGASASDLSGEWDCADLVFDNQHNASVHNGILSISGSPIGPLTIAGLKCENFIVGSRLMTTAGMKAAQQTNITDLVPGNVSVLSPQLYTASATLTGEYRDKVLTVSTRLLKRDFLIETARGSVEWNYAAGFPHLNAVLDDGLATPWSIRVRPSTISGQTNYGAPISLPRIAKINSLANGARTFRLNFCISDAVTWTKKDISVRIQYVDTSGNITTLDSLDLSGAALAAAADVTWSAESGGKVVYTDGGTLSFNKLKIELSTLSGHDLAAGTEVTAEIHVNNTVANVTQYLFIDPEILIA